VTHTRDQISTTERQTRVNVPLHSVQLAVDQVRVPDAREVVSRVDDGRTGREAVEWLEGVQRDELGNPRVSELADIRRGISGEGGEQCLVRRRPAQLLQPHANGRAGAP